MVKNGIEPKDKGAKHNPSVISAEQPSQTACTADMTGEREFANNHSKDLAEDGGTHESPASGCQTRPPYERQWTGPDCSWAWVIAVACSMLNFFAVAVLRSSSVVYVNAIEFYDITRADASWPPSMVNCIANLSGRR